MDAYVSKNLTGPSSKSHERIARGIEQFLIRRAAIIAISAVILLIMLFAAAFNQQEKIETVSQDWVTHTYQVRGDIRELMARIDDIVIGERGYLIAGREDYLDSYKAAVKNSETSGVDAAQPGGSIAEKLAALKNMTSDNPVQQKNLDDVERELTTLINHLDSMIALRKTEGQAALQKVDPARGEQLIERIHDLLNAMIAEENHLLAARTQAEESSMRRNTFFAFGGMTLFCIIVVLSIWLCQKAERRAQAQMESGLRESEQRYGLAIQGLSVGLWDWNVITGEIYWSPRFREIVGIAGTDIAPSLDFVEKNLHPDDRESVMKQLNVYIRNEEAPIYQNECRLRHADGSYVWLYSRGQAISDKEGKTIRMVGCIEDITARKEGEREMEHYIEALKRSNQELDDFAYIASHDLKEPLRGLVNNAMFLKEDFGDKLDESTIKHLDRMTYLCQRMEKLMDNLLYFSRLGRQEMAVQATDLNEVIKDIRSMMETTLQQEHAVIVTPQPLPTITCDLPRITEVFRNLITNAVKYNKSSEKRIEIGCADLEKLAGGNGKRGTAFYVRDNGIGIPEQFYSDIFRIFKRLNDEDDSVKGTGVGLTFVRKIVERHGGTVWPESKVGSGTTFYFTLNPGKEAQT